MFRQVLLASVSLLVVGSSRSLDTQEPLLASQKRPIKEPASAFSDLQACAGNHLTLVKPIAHACYRAKAECSLLKDKIQDGYWLPRQAAGYYFGNWASCQAAGQTCAMPLNNSLPAADSTCYQGSVPDSFIEVTDLKDIQCGLEYAKVSRIPFVIKNTGHDWRGRSAAPGSLALWTHKMQSNSLAGGPPVPITLNRKFKPLHCDDHPEEVVLQFAAGEQWDGVYQFAEDSDLAVLGGTCPSVGVVGWLQGGGHSPLSPFYGLGVDNVRQMEMVTANGEVLIINECTEPDLFFALRGGGAGTWGVITSITYRAVPKFEVQEFTAKVEKLTGTVAAEFFEILTANATRWARRGWGGYIKTNSSFELVNPALNLKDARDDMHPLRMFFYKYGIGYNLTTRVSWYDYYAEYLQPPSAHIGQFSAAVASRLLPPEVFQGQLRNNLTHELLSLHSSGLYLWIMLVAPTAFPHTNTSALHPSWRDAIWSVRINAKWDQYYNQGIEGNWGYFDKVHRGMERLRSLVPDTGVSINEADIWEPNPERAFWGESNYQKLSKIKRKVDPDNLFTNYGAVGWEPENDMFRCYPKQQKPDASLASAAL